VLAPPVPGPLFSWNSPKIWVQAEVRRAAVT
jgi:hypothetical protein